MAEKVAIKSLAGIEYHGCSRITQPCIQALTRIIQYGQRINTAILISNFEGSSGTHAFLLNVHYDYEIIIQNGFSSGYRGEGPSGLSNALKLLMQQGVEVLETQVDKNFIKRLERSALLDSDVTFLTTEKYLKPVKYDIYIHDDYDLVNHSHDSLKFLFPEIIPLKLIDARIIDLALKFQEEPDQVVLRAFRRLEGVVRDAADLSNEVGKKLFAKAFQGEKSIFFWEGLEKSELEGRAQLFIGAYMAYRNPRAHKELEACSSTALREFLVINELFLLQASAVKRESIEA